MAGHLTTYACNKILNHVLKVTPYTPVTPKLTLFTADPTAAGVLTNEMVYTAFTARPTIAFGTAGTPSRGITQGARVTFATAADGSNACTHWGIADSATPGAGNLLAYGPLVIGKTVAAGYTPFVEAGEVIPTFAAGGISTAYAAKVLDWLFRAQTLTPATHLYSTLHSATCSDAAAGTELTGNAYARTIMDAWTTSTAGVSSNSAEVVATAASGDWTTAIHMAIYDHVSAATDYMFWNDCNDLTVLSGEYARWLVNQFMITLA